MKFVGQILLTLSCILCGVSSRLLSEHIRNKRWEGTGDMSNMFRGTAGVDYPNLKTIPNTSFRCDDQEYEGGLYADVEAQCQVYHICHDGRKDSFLCGLGTIFNQQILACDYWYSTECDKAPEFYYVNSQIGNTDPSSWQSQPKDPSFNPQRLPQQGNSQPRDSSFNPQGQPQHGNAQPRHSSFNPQGQPQPGNSQPRDSSINPQGPSQPGNSQPRHSSFNPQGQSQPGNSQPRHSSFNPQGQSQPGNSQPRHSSFNPQGQSQPGNSQPRHSSFNPQGQSQPGNSQPRDSSINPQGPSQPGNSQPRHSSFNPQGLPQRGNSQPRDASFNPQRRPQTGNSQNNPHTGPQGAGHAGNNANEENKKLFQQMGANFEPGQQNNDKSCCCPKNTYQPPWNFPSSALNQNKRK